MISESEQKDSFVKAFRSGIGIKRFFQKPEVDGGPMSVRKSGPRDEDLGGMSDKEWTELLRQATEPGLRDKIAGAVRAILAADLPEQVPPYPIDGGRAAGGGRLEDRDGEATMADFRRIVRERSATLTKNLSATIDRIGAGRPLRLVR